MIKRTTDRVAQMQTRRRALHMIDSELFLAAVHGLVPCASCAPATFRSHGQAIHAQRGRERSRAYIQAFGAWGRWESVCSRMAPGAWRLE